MIHIVMNDTQQGAWGGSPLILCPALLLCLSSLHFLLHLFSSPPTFLSSHPPSPHRLLSRVALCTEFFITGHLLPATAKDGSRHRRQTRVPSPDTKSRNNNVILYERQQNEERTGEGRGGAGGAPSQCERS